MRVELSQTLMLFHWFFSSASTIYYSIPSLLAQLSAASAACHTDPRWPLA